MSEIFALPFEVGPDVVERAKKIKLIIFDVDGVLTDGSLFIGDDKQEYKSFNSKDGHGMKMLIRSGVDIGIITGRTSKVVEHRMGDLGIKHVFQGCHDKLPVYEKLIAELKLSPEETAFVGDDVVDLPIMLKAGLSITVNDGHHLAKNYAHWATPANGGQGAAREICEMIMHAQGNYGTAMEKYL
jgi:3-deoxy-D-manno-octulosonate 8-phosphate phosphatase (KDO 8-P phosphatase)